MRIRRRVLGAALLLLTVSCTSKAASDAAVPSVTAGTARSTPVESAPTDAAPSSTVVAHTTDTTGGSAASTGPDFDAMPSIRAAFYYPWFPETWHTPSGAAFTNFHPDRGQYRSLDPAVLRRHLDELAYAHVDVAIASWWGEGSATAERFDSLLDATTTELRWSIYYEPESEGDPTADELVSDLQTLVSAHADDPRLFRLDGRFVVFVYGDAGEDCALTQRWHDAAQRLGIYVVLKVFDGYQGCPTQPDAWHQYAPARVEDSQPPWSYTVSPGFWKYGESPRLARDPDAFLQAVTRMVAAQPKLQLITTFNEWGEGTAVEPAREWSTGSGYGVYLDILHGIPPRP